MSGYQFTRGLNWWDPEGDYDALLVDGYTPNLAHELADILPYESSASGYARTGTFTVTESFDDVLERAQLDADDFVFGTLAADDPGPSHLIVVRWITDDTDSVALVAYDCDAFRSTFPDVRVSSRGLMRSVANGII